MTMTETAKHLAKPNSEPLSGATTESPDHLDLVIQRIHQQAFQRDLVEAITEQIAPLSVALDTIGKESWEHLTQMKALTERFQKEAGVSLQAAERAARELETRSQGLTIKLWAGMLLVSLLVSATSVISYSLWQRQHSGEKAAALNWTDFEARWQRIPVEQQRRLHRALYGD
jgi:hypothetical protein